jgi:hypothetical protein
LYLASWYFATFGSVDGWITCKNSCILLVLQGKLRAKEFSFIIKWNTWLV